MSSVRPTLHRHVYLSGDSVLCGRQQVNWRERARLRTNATLVGEPIGERPNSYQEGRTFNTRNARLRVGVSIKFYEALPGAGDPEAVTPHVSRPPTWARIAHGEDDALQWVRRQ